MTENPATEQSMLAPHRVKPYHFKGFNEQKQQAILDERAGQIRAQEAAKLSAKEQEKQWAIQQEQIRRLQILKDREFKRVAREVTIGTRAAQEQQKEEKAISWKDHYDEKGPTHNNY